MLIKNLKNKPKSFVKILLFISIILSQMNKLIFNAQKNFIRNIKYNFGVVSNQHLSKDAEVI